MSSISKKKSKSKKIQKSKSVERLIQEISKKEQEAKAAEEERKQKERQQKEAERKERREKRGAELREKCKGEEQARIDQKLEALKASYNAKYVSKLDYGVKTIESQEAVIVVNNEDTLNAKYNYNVIPDQIIPIENAYHKMVKGTKRGVTEQFGCRIIDLKQAAHVKASLENENGYRIHNFLSSVKHPNIVSPVIVFLIAEKVYIFHELLIHSLEVYVKVGGGLNEVRTRLFSRDIGEALSFLHTHGIAHRNVHVGSVLIDSANNSAKLSNFELSCVYWKPEVSQVKLFTSIYPKGTKFAAREARGEPTSPYNVKKADVWSWANMVVYMLTKENMIDDFDKFRDSKLSTASPECKELLQKCFDKPENRPEFPEILSLSWFLVFAETGGQNTSPVNSLSGASAAVQTSKLPANID